jgi:DNA-binding MarR family transcriptional regulator
MSSAEPATFNLFRTYRVIARALEARMAATADLTLSAGEVLAWLGAREGDHWSVVDLASATGLSRSGITRVVDRLEKQQLVLRRASSADQRRVELEITDAGGEIMQAVFATFELLGAEDIASILSSEEVDSLEARLERLTRRVDRDQEEDETLEATTGQPI